MESKNIIGNNIENALAGRYHLKIGAVLKEAWHRVKGLKGRLWGAFILALLVIFVIRFIQGVFEGFGKAAMADGHTSIFFFAGLIAFIIAVISTVINLALNGGLLLMALRHITSQPFKFSTVFLPLRSIKLLLRILGAHVLLVLMCIIPVLLCMSAVLPALHTAHINHVKPSLGIGSWMMLVVGFCLFLYIALSYIFTVPLMIERKLGVWRSVKISMVSITRHWFKVFFLSLIGSIIILCLSSITLGIGFIWLFPMGYNIYAIIYREILGVEVKGLENY